MLKTVTSLNELVLANTAQWRGASGPESTGPDQVDEQYLVQNFAGSFCAMFRSINLNDSIIDL